MVKKASKAAVSTGLSTNPPDGLPFSAATREWFGTTFDGPTDAQRKGWQSISQGKNTLVLAPTGSGKTLAAFLWAIDRLVSQPPPTDPKARLRVLYVSPLKSLSYDVERNLRSPLKGIGIAAQRLGEEVSEIRVATRTGDTPQADRRDIQRNPPDILITTPESLYLMLTSSAHEVLASVDAVIIDEIHAMAPTKRGAHLALSLERLERLVKLKDPACRVQRIGLSATQRPLDEVARFLGGRERDAQTGEYASRQVEIVDAGVRKQLELQVVVPVEDMSQLGKSADRDDELVMSGPAAGEPEVRSSIWPAIYPKLLELIRAHTSTLIFVNSRRLAERLANHLNDLAAEQDGHDGDGPVPELVRSHHGSIAREQRLEIEDALKAGRIPALVATSSLELGIDMGAIDLVVQVEAPTSVASGMQRIGRAGHQVGAPSKGTIFPKFRGDLVSAAVASERMQAGLIETTKVPQNPLDVLAQQIVAMVAVPYSDQPVTVDDVAAMAYGAYPFAELSKDMVDATLDMLAGRYPSDEFGELRARINWDRVTQELTPRKGAQMLAVTSGGTIPDRGLFGVFTPEGSRVGELDEEMVYESRVGEHFLLGATTWKIIEITKERVVVVPAPGEVGKMPFWHGDSIGRPYELGQAVGAFLRRLDDIDDFQLADSHGLDELAIRNLRQYVNEEKQATEGLLPSDRQIVIERFRDELGDWRVCILSPFGARVHAPWTLGIEAKMRDSLGYEVQAIWSDDGIVLRLPEADELPPIESLLLQPDEIDDLIVSQVGNSAVFAARFRENAARALLLPRRRPGSRTPLWQMRQRAANLLTVATRYGDFPIVLETYRECLRDVFDLPALGEVMSNVVSRKIRVSSVDTAMPSPFAAALVFNYVASFMYDGDAPLAERRAQALTLDRRMLNELVGGSELRDLIDPDALDRLELELQCLVDSRLAVSVDDALDLLRKLGDLTADELDARCVGSHHAEILRTKRAFAVRVAGEERLIAAEDAARYRDALGVSLPIGVPDAFLEPVEDAVLQLVRRFARTHGPFVARDVAERLGMPIGVVDSALRSLQADQRVDLGEFRPGGSDLEWCDVEVLRLLRQRSLAALRKEVEPTDVRALVRFVPAWQGVGSDARGIDRVYDVISQLQGVPIALSALERDVLFSRVRNYSPVLLDELMSSGEVMWVGAGPLGRADGKVRLLLRHMAPHLLSRTTSPAERFEEPEHNRIRELLAARGACFFRELEPSSDRETLAALWDLVWAGEVTNDSFAAARAVLGKSPRGSAASSLSASRRRRGQLSGFGPPTAQGRWSLVSVGDVDPTRATTEVVQLLLERHGVLTREAVRSEGVSGGFAGIYPVLKAMEESGRIRRGYFVEGLGGAQFALPGAVDRLRDFRDSGREAAGRVVLLSAVDPANPFGGALPWPEKGPTRVPGAYVLIVDGELGLYLERNGKGIVVFKELDGTWEATAMDVVVGLLERGEKRLNFASVPEELKPYLLERDFVPTPKGLVRYA